MNKYEGRKIERKKDWNMQKQFRSGRIHRWRKMARESKRDEERGTCEKGESEDEWGCPEKL